MKPRHIMVAGWPAFKNRRDNPYTALLYEAMPATISVVEATHLFRKLRRIDILHVHWPENILSRPPWRMLKGLVALLVLLTFVKSTGGKVVWTVHNLLPHERRYPVLEPMFYRMMVALTDGAIFLSHASLKEASITPHLESLLKKRFAVIPHGHYRDAYPMSTESKEAARVQLGLPESGLVLLFFGRLYPYKGLEELIEVFRCLPYRDWYLVLAGRPESNAFLRRLISAAGDDRRIRIIPEFVPPARVPVLLKGADWVILPYRRILNSGAAMLALSFGVPVVGPRQGSFLELEDFLGTGWVRLFDPPLRREHLEQLGEPALRDVHRLEQFLESRSWDRIAEETIRFYHAVLQCTE